MRLLIAIITSFSVAFFKLFRWPLHLILRYVIRYRESIITENLKNSFPSKSDKEIKTLFKDYLLHFTDFLLEYLILFKGDSKFYEENIKIENWQEVEDVVNSGSHVIIAMGHQGSWEFAAVRLSQLFSIKMTGIYKKIKNPKVDKLVFNARSKFGLHLLEIKDSVKGILKMRSNPAAHLFIMDQSPRKSQSNRWLRFLNQDTLVLEGVEKMSKALKAQVFWLSVEKTNFAEYRMSLKKLDQDKVLENCYKELEKDILHQPETWLWSHRRWKIKKTS